MLRIRIATIPSNRLPVSSFTSFDCFSYLNVLSFSSYRFWRARQDNYNKKGPVGRAEEVVRESEKQARNIFQSNEIVQCIKKSVQTRQARDKRQNGEAQTLL
jgi:hypothetical protein